MVALKNLLAQGYFPRELPPTFQTTSFSQYAVANLATLRAKHGSTSCVSHNLARAGGLRRPLKIPNPISFFRLAEVVTDNWLPIRRFTWRVPFSSSRPMVQTSSGRAIIACYRNAELPRLRAFHRRGAKFIVKADVSQFYPSVYTHALCWSAHTKAICKARLPKSKRKGKPKLWGEELDEAASNVNWGQTVGIPIGPDTSLVIAEVLLSSIDQDLFKHRKLFRGFRTVDDYEFTCATLGDAEETLTLLQGLLADVELSLNPLKTYIRELPEPLEENWSIAIRTFEISNSSYKSQRRDIVDLFSRAHEFADACPKDYVLKYVVNRVGREKIFPEAWPAFQNCLLGAASSEPSALAPVLGGIVRCRDSGRTSCVQIWTRTGI